MDPQVDRHADEIDVEDETRRAIVRALNRAPYDVWTRDSLARSLGVSSGLTGRILTQLAGAGMVHLLPGSDDEYTVAGDDLIGA
jgi:DNA-binding IscR family transcriptional regulator